MNHLIQDARVAWRKLRQTPGRSLAAVLIVGLAAGANAAIYTLADNYYIGDPANQADDVALVGVRFRDPAMNYFFMFEPELIEPLEQGLRSFARLARVTYYDLALTGVDRPLRGNGLRVGPGFSEIVRMPIRRGRALEAPDFRPGAEKVALLAEHAWQTSLGGRDDALGRLVGINGETYRVVGIYADTFAFEHSRYEAVTASSFREPSFAGLQFAHVWLVGQLAPGVTVAQAGAEVKGLEGQLAKLVSAEYFAEHTLGVRRAGERSHTISERQIGALLTAGAVILLTATLNLVGAGLVQINQRRAEWATRLALGARRWDLVRLFTVEMGLLIASGYALGLVIAYGLVHVVRTQFTRAARGLLALLKPEDIHLSWRVLVVTLLACVLVVAVTAATTFVFSRTRRLAAILNGASRGVGGGAALRWASSLMVFTQIAVTCGLTVVGAFFLSSAGRVMSYDHGYALEGIVRSSVFLPYHRLAGGENAPELVPLLEAVGEAVRGVPGVRDARFARLEFPHWGERRPVRLEDTPAGVGESALPQAREGVIGPGFLELLNVRTLRGEGFSTATNRTEGERVALVNQAFAEQIFKGRDPIDQFIEVGGRRLRVIGVVGDIRRWQIGSGRAQGQALDAAEPAMYFPAAQSGGRSSAFLYVKADDWSARREQEVRAAVARVDPDVVVAPFGTLREQLARSENTFRLLMFVQVLLAAIGATLSCLAVFAAVTHWVTERRREWGIRLALGARPRAISARVLAHTARLVAPAALAGAALTHVALGRGLLRSQLYLVTVGDAAPYVACALALAVVGFSASLHPAWKAARLLPNEVLREG